MGYRVNKIPPKPENFLPVYPVRNGATLYADFECYYVDPTLGHDPHWHDYLGWPDPHHPDKICQMRPPRDRRRWRYDGHIWEKVDRVPIDLLDEGYDREVKIVFDEPDEHITAKAYIDTELTHLIKLAVSVQMPTFEDKPIDKRFTLFVTRDDEDLYATTADAVVRGVLTILPGAPLFFDDGHNTDIR